MCMLTYARGEKRGRKGKVRESLITHPYTHAAITQTQTILVFVVLLIKAQMSR